LADGGYAGQQFKKALASIGCWTIEIVKRSDATKAFKLLPRRWVVERTVAWLNRNRRLAKDFEATIASAKTWLMIASVKLLKLWSFRRLSIWSEPRKLRLRSFSVPRRDQMNSHKNAPLTPKGREAMVRCVEAGLNKTAAARQFNTTPKTVAKWVERFRAGGVDGLRDRSSRPLSLPSQTASATCAAVEALRRQRYTLKSKPPISRLGLTEDNLLRLRT
jgi:hypothetical protein